MIAVDWGCTFVCGVLVESEVAIAIAVEPEYYIADDLNTTVFMIDIVMAAGS